MPRCGRSRLTPEKAKNPGSDGDDRNASIRFEQRLTLALADIHILALFYSCHIHMSKCSVNSSYVHTCQGGKKIFDMTPIPADNYKYKGERISKAK
jgi:hypothetical protein